MPKQNLISLVFCCYRQHLMQKSVCFGDRGKVLIGKYYEEKGL